MNTWIEKAHYLLEQSLTPIPKELNELDWKSGLSENSEKLSKHISAFTNYADGGYMVYGINNNGLSHPLSQVEIEQITQKLGNIARHSLSHSIAIEHAVENYKGEPVLFIHIPEHHEKPVYLKGKDMFESYTRSAGQTVKLSAKEVKQLISISDGYTFESQIALHGASQTDIVVQYLDIDSYFSLQEKKLPTKISGIVEALATDDLVRHSNGNWDVLNLGAILFAKNINKFKTLQRKAIRVVVYKDTNKVNAIKEQVGVKGYASAFKGLIHYIMEQLPTNEVIENAIRTKVKVYPEVAIREFVANALIHQDFAMTGAGVMIEIFKDRIEITNPGIPLIDTNRFIDTAPKSRNETLAGLMRRLNICEERGSGQQFSIKII